MILYFANRKMEILGHASTNLKDGFKVSDDLKTEEVETGVAVFECDLFFDDDSRIELESMAETGNYLLRSHDDENEFYTIIDTETDTERRTIYIYAEDAGLDLINEVVGAYEADEAHTAEWYVNKYTKDSGFEIGINEIPADSTRTLSWDGEATVTERLASIATQFGGFEVSYTFSVQGMEITHKYINIYEQRGKDVDDQLRLNKDINRIITKKSVANLATALYVTGGTPEGKDKPITLNGYEYDDGDFYVDGKYLKSRNAVAKWSRYVWEKNVVEGYEGHIVNRYSYDTTDQKTLCSHAVTELKKICDTEVNYEVEISKLPENIKIGDRINIVDDRGELYLSTRILKLEKSVANGTQKATLGEYLIRDSGISQKVQALAEQFQELAQNRVLYTWRAYADDDQGNGISLDPEGKDYMGVSANHIEKTPDITDPSIYTWSKIKGDQGDPGSSGEDGRSEVSNVTEYYLSTSSMEPTGGTWSEQMPEWESGKYIWKRNRITWSDGTVTYTDPILDTALNHANEAADYATGKAEEAATAAGNAQASATIAQEQAELSSQAAADAQESANTANTNATNAIDKANAAQTAADEANAQVTIINSEITSIKEDQTDIRNEMSAEITTIKETMEASYAKKTDVSDTEMELRAEISRSAAEIQTTMESDYAKKTELTAVQSSLQTQITQNAQEISSTASAVETVQIDATEAQSKAEEAVQTAAEAQNTAQTAVSAAQDAQESADAATLAAQTAQTEATKAQTEADTAKQAAEDAKAVADAAQTDLDAAKQNLTNVTNRVDATEEEIAAAQAAVDEAQQKADEANASAAEAQAAADAAQASADTAKQNAATAQATADTAKQNAAAAQTAADEAKAEADKANAAVGNLANTVTDMQTQISQNAEEIELAATKTEVQEYLSGYYTKEEADSALTVKANEIASSVSSTYATKNELANTNSSVATAQNTADSAKTTAENAQSSIDNLEVGGRNLIKNSDFSDGTSKWKLEGGLTSSKGSDNDFSIYREFVHTESYPSQRMYPDINTNFTNSIGTDYVLSFYAKSNEAVTLRVGVQAIYDVSDFALSASWEKYTKIYTASNSGSLSFFLLSAGTYQLANVKLERGNKATDWTPAPEDSEEAINSATQAAQDAQESANNAQNTANQAQSGVDALESRVTTAETNIIQNTEAIGLRATKTEVQEYLSGYSTKEETESAINLASASIRAEVNASIGAISGGDNILRGTNVETELVAIDTSTWETGQWKLRGTGTATSYIMTDSPISSLNIAWTIKGAAYPAKYGGIQQTQITIEPGTYTVSVWAKNTSADSTLSAQLAFYLGNSQIGGTISVGKNWGRYSATFSVETESITIAFYNPSSITSTDICGMTLNKGETASPWTPSTFDIGDDLTAIRASLELKVDKTALISEINASANVIRLTGNRFVVNSDNFSLTQDGTMTATNGTFNGSVNATSITAMNRYSIRNEENFVFARLAIKVSDGITTGKSVSRVILGKAVLNSGGDITNHKGVSLIAPVNIYSAVSETSSDCTYSDDDMIATIDESGLATFNKLAVSGISTLGITGFTGTCRPSSEASGDVDLGGTCRPSSEASGDVDLGSTAYPWYNLYLSHCVYYTDPPSGGGTAVYINSNGAIVKYSSDRRLKNSIEAVASDELNPERLYDLPIWQYKYNDDVLEDGDDLKNKTVIGFMADEVASIYPRACACDSDGTPTSWNPNVMIPAMLALIQKQKQEIEELRALI